MLLLRHVNPDAMRCQPASGKFLRRLCARTSITFPYDHGRQIRASRNFYERSLDDETRQPL